MKITLKGNKEILQEPGQEDKKDTSLKQSRISDLLSHIHHIAIIHSTYYPKLNNKNPFCRTKLTLKIVMN